MKRPVYTSILFVLLLSLFIPAQPVLADIDNIVLSDQNLIEMLEPYLKEDIQNTLVQANSPLSTYSEPVGTERLTAADSIWVATQQRDFSINAKPLIAILKMDGTMDSQPEANFTLSVDVLSQKLGEYYLEYQAGVNQVSLRSGKQIPILSNGATYALAKYFAPLCDDETVLKDKLNQWTTAYRTLFLENPSASVLKLLPETSEPVTPFLNLPYKQPSDSFIQVNSFFDHARPSVEDDSILRFDGITLKTAGFANCALGINCYGGHIGIDYRTGAGMPILAAADGTVILQYFNKDPNQGSVDSRVAIDHGNGYWTRYFHMDPIVVKYGQTVSKGQLLGYSGNVGKSSGAHLHFDVKIAKQNKVVDPFGWWNTSVADYWGDSSWLWQGDLIADNQEAQAQLFNRTYWNREPRGYQGESWWTYSVSESSKSSNWAIWGAYIPKAGLYDVYAYIPKRSDNTKTAKYKIFNAGGSTNVTIDQSADGDRWVSLGSFNFAKGATAVLLSDLTAERGKRVYFDAIKWEPHGSPTITNTPIPANTGTFDDSDNRIQYQGSWLTYNGAGPYNNSLHYSTNIGNTAMLTFNGTRVSLLYTGEPHRGHLEIVIDGVHLTDLNEALPPIGYQKKWDSPLLSAGSHTLSIRHAQGEQVDLDAIIVAASVTSTPSASPTSTKKPTSTVTPTQTAPPVTSGTIDDNNVNIVYSGTWASIDNSDAFNGSIHQGNKSGSSATLTFKGRQISLIYNSDSTRGSVDLSIDGIKLVSISQNSRNVAWQKRWVSPALSANDHTISIKQTSSEPINIDGFVISSEIPPATATPYPIAGVGTYDDTYPGISYTGSWQAWISEGPQENSLHLSSVTGSTASLTFRGSQISLLYTGFTNRGVIDVFIDGTIVGQINQSSNDLNYQKRWDSYILQPIAHTITLRHLSGNMIDLDAFIVSQPLTPPTTLTPSRTPTALTPSLTSTVPTTPETVVHWGDTNADSPLPRDYNNDGKAEIALYQNGYWYIQGRNDVSNWGGVIGDLPLPADYTGDGKIDIAIYRKTGYWYIKGLDAPIGWGGGDKDIPVPADYNGDKKTDIAVYRNGYWYVWNIQTTGWGVFDYDIPVPADYNGDGKDDIAIYRNGLWYVIGLGEPINLGGVKGDIPVPADYNGDGKDEAAIYRSGAWYIAGNSQPLIFGGEAGDKPIPADYNGDGKAEFAFYRNGYWHILK